MKPFEADQIVRQVAQRIIDKQRGDGAGGFGLWAKDVLEPKIDPRTRLLCEVRAAVEQIAGIGEYTYRRPNRRSPSPNCPLPASVAPLPRITVVVDTSGSMDQRDLGLALGLIGKVLKSLPNRNGVRVVCGDAELHTAANVFDPKQISLAGGGGTDMGHVIQQAAQERAKPQLIVCVTDGETDWPARPLPMPVVACLTRAEQSYCPVPKWIRKVELIP